MFMNQLANHIRQYKITHYHITTNFTLNSGSETVRSSLSQNGRQTEQTSTSNIRHYVKCLFTL